MKYIRTKDAIFELANTEIHFGKTEELKSVKFYKAYQPERISLCKHKYTRSVEVSRVIKSADTIEELCDEFVGIDSQGHYIIHNDEFIKGARIVPLEEVSYYGAIWTDKGLIFVAKMNDKGELELL